MKHSRVAFGHVSAGLRMSLCRMPAVKPHHHGHGSGPMALASQRTSQRQPGPGDESTGATGEMAGKTTIGLSLSARGSNLFDRVKV